MSKIKLFNIKIGMIAVLMMLLCIVPEMTVKADSASAITFGLINYELLTLQVFNQNNNVVYYSMDNDSWEEVEGAYDSATKSYTMDISWVSTTSDVTLYFKGDVIKTVKTITLPAMNTSFAATFDKVDTTFIFDNTDEADSFEWRKSTNYNWVSVDLDESDRSYIAFLDTVEKFRVCGASIIIRLPQEIGYGAGNVGMRQSKEITVSIPARAAAPTVKVNSSNLTVNTSTAMEYYDSSLEMWIECSSAMSLFELAPMALYEYGGTEVTVKIRRSATASTPYSKTTYLTIPAQLTPPTIGDSSKDVTYYFMNSKLILQFNKASATNLYEYTIVKPDYEFEVSTASWKSVKTATAITLTGTTAPDGCTIYVRKKGTDANTAKGTAVVLASATNSFLVEY